MTDAQFFVLIAVISAWSGLIYFRLGTIANRLSRC